MKAALTPKEALAAIDDATSSLKTLKSILEEETDLLKRAKLYEAASLESAKNRAAHAYLEALDAMRNMGSALKLHATPALQKLQQLNEELQKTINLNLTVLATSRSVSEGLINEVAETMNKKNQTSGYGVSGHEAKIRGQVPIAISRSL